MVDISNLLLESGQIVQVKAVGVLALLDEGEVDGNVIGMYF